ncbi:MAG: hypothetical protein JO045_12580, partial [Mycobacterium sp.]|nr:hypothetical protein [Mycobacterium sp.]
MTPRPMGPRPDRPVLGGRRLRWWPVAVVAAALALAAGAGFAIHTVTTHSRAPRQTAQGGYRVGACVQLKPSPSGELHAADTSCDTDPSFV